MTLRLFDVDDLTGRILPAGGSTSQVPIKQADGSVIWGTPPGGAPSGTAGGDLSGTYPNPQIASGVIVDTDINAAAAIAESKLALASDAAAGTASRRSLGTGATQATAGNDTRLSDTRTPTNGTVTDVKVAVGAAIAESKLSLASDAAAGTASRRSLGTGATQATAGNDTRLSDARTPTAHATSHNVGGSDPVQRFIEKDFIFQGALPTANGTTTGTLRVPIIVSATIVAITVTINALPVGAGSSQTLDLLRSGTTVYTTTANRPSFVPGGSQFITATLPDVVALTGGTHYLTANLITAGAPSSGGTSIVMTVRYRQ